MQDQGNQIGQDGHGTDDADDRFAAERRCAAAIARGGGLCALNRVSTTLERLCGVLSAHLKVAPESPERDLINRLLDRVGPVFVAVRLERLLHPSPNQPADEPGIGG